MEHSNPAPNRSLQKKLFLGLTLVIAILTGILYWHGVSWWYAPIALVVSIVLVHLVIAVGLVGLGVPLIRLRNRRRKEDHSNQGEVITKPGLYDWLVRIILLGREKKVREGWLELAELKAGDAVLDVGCGTGTLLLAAAGQVGSTGRFRGLEASVEMVEFARSKGRTLDLDMKFTIGSAEVLPYDNDSFDVVMCTLVLHHLPMDIQSTALREMSRVLRPGGRIVVVDMSNEPGMLRRGLSLILVLHGSQVGKLVDVEVELKACGLHCVTQHPGGSNALVATLGYSPKP